MTAAASLTLRQVAERLGVHYMTVYRHVRTGKLPARWQDGQWLVDEADLPVPGAARPGGAGRAGARAVGSGGRRRPGWAQWTARLEQRLVAGDEPGAWAVAQAAMAAGAAPERVLLDVVAPAMVAIGRRWETGELTVADEHRASQVATRVLARLGPSFARPGRKRAAVVVGTPPGERHALPVAMAVDVLRGAGHQVVDLGVDVPAAMFARVAERTPQLLAVAVGVTRTGQERAVAQVVSAVRGAVPGVPVLVGGAGVPGGAAATRLGADRWSGADARSLLDAVAAVESGSGGRRAPTPVPSSSTSTRRAPARG